MHLLYAVCHLSVKQYKQKDFNEIQKNPTAAASVVLISVISKIDITEIEITNLSTYIILFRYKTERYYIIIYKRQSSAGK